VAGNGGEMALAMQTLEMDEKSGITSGTTKKGPGKKAGGRPTRKSGAALLRKLADRQVALNSKKLTDVLTRKALAGDLASTRMLVGLAERKEAEPKPEKKWRGLSLAQELAMEPEWVGPPEEIPENWDRE